MTTLPNHDRRTVGASLARIALASFLFVASPSLAQPAVLEAEAEVAAPGGLDTVAVAALSSYDNLMTDVKFLGEIAGRPETASMAEGMIALFTQGRGLVGLDKSRPLGIVLQTDGAQFVPVGCLPVDDLPGLLELVQGMGLMAADIGDGVTELELPQQTIYLKPVDGWTLVGQSPEAFESAPADPGEALSSLVQEYDLGVRVHVQNVPEMYRQIALEQLRQGMEQGLEQDEAESDEDFALRGRLAEAQVDQIADMIEGLDEVTVGWNLDSERRSTNLDVAMTAIAGTDLAIAFSTYEDPKSEVAAFHKADAAMSMYAGGTNAPEVVEKQREQIEIMIQTFRDQATREIEESDEPNSEVWRTALKGAVLDLLDAYEALALGGKSDIAGSLSLAGQGGTFIAGTYLSKPEKIEAALQKLADAAEQEPTIDGQPVPRFKMNADTHGDVKFHLIKLPIPEDTDEVDAEELERIKAILGDELRATVGIGPEHVYFAAGTDSLNALKQAIDASASRSGEVMNPPVEMFVSLKQVFDFAKQFAGDEAEAVAQMLAGAFEGVEPGKDRLRVEVNSIENGFRIRYEAEEGVLKAVGAAAAAAAAMQQGEGF